jgi:hypothetical protein
MAVNYDEVVSATHTLQVSVDDLEGISKWCVNVGSLVPDLRNEVKNATDKAREGGAGKVSAFGPGGPEGIGAIIDNLCARMKGTQENVDKALRDIAISLDRTSNAIKFFSSEYLEREQRNQIGARAVLEFVTGSRKEK